MEPEQVRPLRARLDLGVMAMKGYSPPTGLLKSCDNCHHFDKLSLLKLLLFSKL